MKSYGLKNLFSVAMAFSVLGLTPSWACGLKQGVPHEHFQDVNSIGKLSYWFHLDDVDFGNGLQLPLNINFRSDRRKSSPYLGQGWMMPLLEQSFIQRNERVFVMRQPNGFVTLFKRTKQDNTLLRGREGWMARITGDHTIQAYASCGWSLDFTDGKITDMHTPDNRDISFVRQNGVVQSVEVNGTPLITVNFDTQTGKATGLSYNDKAITFEQSNKPMVHHQQGKLLVTRIVQSLHQVTLPDGQKETYDFAVDDKMKPTLKVSGSDSHLFTWSPRSKRILTDGDWKYKIVRAAKDDRMIRGGIRYANAQIQRTNGQGQTESWFRDLKNGETTIQKLDGTKIVKDRFVGSGLAGKMRKVVVTQQGKSTVRFQAIYDENHQLVRKIDGDGNVFEWKAVGSDRIFTENNVPLLKTTYDGTGRPISEVDLKTKIQTTYSYTDQGSQQIVQYPNGQRFVQIYDPSGKMINGHYLNN